jgi:uncharacterized membrane protein SpoIIM required for sporulation
VDLDRLVTERRPDWDRLDRLGRRRRLTGPEADELVALYQSAGADLTRVRSAGTDPATAARLSGVLARARTVLTGARTPAWRAVADFFTVDFPVTVYRSARWSLWAAGASLALAAVLAGWVSRTPSVLANLGTGAELRQLAYTDFESYYSTDSAAAFGARVWTNNAFIAAQCLVVGVLLVPVVLILASNAANIGVSAGVMASFGRLDVFFSLIVPHGLLELTAVFVAAGAGMRLGWSWIDPGPLSRGQSLARTGRATVRAALGLTVVLAVSGLLESVVTPSPLPTWARVGIGVVVEVAFLGYVIVLGRRGVAAGRDGDLAADAREAVLPTAG